MRIPVIVIIKNTKHHFFTPEMGEGGHNTDEFDEIVLSQLPDSLSRDRVVAVTCFCKKCQNEMAMGLNVIFSRLEFDILDKYPLFAIAEIVPILEDQTGLVETWPIMSHLVEAALAAYPHVKLAQIAADEYKKVNQA